MGLAQEMLLFQDATTFTERPGVRGASMPVPSFEQQARHKVRIAMRLLADAQRLYEEGGRPYGGPGLNAEALGQMVEELTHRIAEADRLTPLGS
jgi:hypothetical protein